MGQRGAGGGRVQARSRGLRAGAGPGGGGAADSTERYGGGSDRRGAGKGGGADKAGGGAGPGRYLSGLPAAGLAGAASCGEAPSPAERGRTLRGGPTGPAGSERCAPGSGRALKDSPGRAPPGPCPVYPLSCPGLSSTPSSRSPRAVPRMRHANCATASRAPAAIAAPRKRRKSNSGILPPDYPPERHRPP